MVILGVDPGTLVTGFGVISAERGRVALLACDVVRNRSDRSMPLRLEAIYNSLLAVIEQYKPDEFAIETAFYGKNAQSALKIGHARGVAILAAVHRQLPTTEYAPREIKKSVTGNGAASKEQVQYMVKSLLTLRTIPKSLDASDAVAVALCHLQHLRPANKSARTSRSTWKEYVIRHPERIVRSR